MPQNKVKLSKNARQVMDFLFTNQSHASVSKMEKQLKISRRSVYYAINNIDEYLLSMKLRPLQTDKNGYFIPEAQKEKLLGKMGPVNIVLDPKVRNYYLICCIVYPREPIYLTTLTDLLGMSRNTIINDLAEVKQVLEKSGLSFLFSKKAGYSVQGEEFRKRSVLLHYTSLLLKCINYRNLPLYKIDILEHIWNRLKIVLKQLGIIITEERQIAMACLIYVLVHNEEDSYDFNVMDLKTLYASKEFKLIKDNFTELKEHQMLYLTIHLLGFRENRDFLQDTELISKQQDIKTLTLSRELVNTFERIACIQFNEKENLVNSIYLHLKLSLYIYSYSASFINPLAEEIKENYQDLFKITAYCCKYHQEQFPFPLFEEEIAYLSMHFGSSLNKGVLQQKRFNALIVCPNGKTTSALLQNEIDTYFEQIRILAAVPIEQIDNYDNVDFVIATVKFESRHPVVLVNPILTPEDRSQIASFLMTSPFAYRVNQRQYNKILSVIGKHVNQETLVKIRNELYEMMNMGESLLHIEENKVAGIVEMFETFGIRFDETADMDWRQAIYNASSILVDEKYITNGYVTKMINLVEQHGPYIVVNERMAIAHANPADGVRRLALTCTIFPNGLDFGRFNIQFLFVLATPNQNDHLYLLREIVHLYENPHILDKLLRSNSFNAVDIVREFFKNHEFPN